MLAGVATVGGTYDDENHDVVIKLPFLDRAE